MVANRAEHDREYMTIEEYLELDENTEGIRYEYIDGYPYMMTGGTVNHGRIATNIARLLGNALEGGPCEVFSSDIRVRLAEKRFLQPDVTVSCQEEEHPKWISHPRVVVEVLSPGTKVYDEGHKYLLYQQCPTIEAVMIVDSEKLSVTLFHREGKVWENTPFSAGETVEIEWLGVSLPMEKIYRGVRFP